MEFDLSFAILTDSIVGLQYKQKYAKSFKCLILYFFYLFTYINFLYFYYICYLAAVGPGVPPVHVVQR